MPVNPKLLRRSLMFRDLPAADVNGIAELAAVRWANRGDYVFRRGEPMKNFYVVFDGALKLSRSTSGGKIMIVDFRGPGDVVGGRGVVGHPYHAEDARAIEDTLVAAIPVVAAVELLSTRPNAVMALARYLAARLDSKERKVAALSTKRVHQRLAAGLVELGRTLGAQADGTLIINARLTQAELAEWIGTTRETTSTLLNGLRKAGYIDIVGRRIHLLHPDALQTYATLEEPPADLSLLGELSSGSQGAARRPPRPI